MNKNSLEMNEQEMIVLFMIFLMHAYLSNANHVISKDDPKFLSSMKAVGLCWQPREEKVRSEDTKTAMVHTGMWGCGSFKGL